MDEGAKPTDLKEARPSHAARRGLALILAGDTEAGLAAYDKCLSGARPHALPIGLDLLFIESAGKTEAAADLRALTLRRGGDLSVKALSFGASPSAAAAEYEALFSSGIGNSRMVYEYLVVLARLGRLDEVAAILDMDRLVRILRLDDLTHDGRAGGLAPAIQALLLDEEARAVDRDAVQPLSKVRMLERLHRSEDSGARALVTALAEQAHLYLRDWAASDHLLAHLVPRRFDLRAWGLIAREGGFSSRHLHPNGWATGVYYPAGLAGPGAGELRIGPPAELDEGVSGWPGAAIRPGARAARPDAILLHALDPPNGGTGVRTSVAFDLVGAD